MVMRPDYMQTWAGTPAHVAPLPDPLVLVWFSASTGVSHRITLIDAHHARMMAMSIADEDSRATLLLRDTQSGTCEWSLWTGEKFVPLDALRV